MHGLVVCAALGAWDSGPVLHSHAAVDEAFFVVSGTLEVQLGENRHQASAGAFIWVPRGTAHTFANAGEDQVHVLALAMPGGIENMLAEQFAHISTAQDGPDPSILSAIGERHGAPTLAPPIRARDAPPLPD